MNNPETVMQTECRFIIWSEKTKCFGAWKGRCRNHTIILYQAEADKGVGLCFVAQMETNPGKLRKWWWLQWLWLTVFTEPVNVWHERVVLNVDDKWSHSFHLWLHPRCNWAAAAVTSSSFHITPLCSSHLASAGVNPCVNDPSFHCLSEADKVLAFFSI